MERPASQILEPLALAGTLAAAFVQSFGAGLQAANDNDEPEPPPAASAPRPFVRPLLWLNAIARIPDPARPRAVA